MFTFTEFLNENVVLYHGGSTLITTFSFDHNGEGSDLLGKGIYLTASKKVARFYAELVCKKDKISHYSYDKIFGSAVPHYQDDAIGYSQEKACISTFKVTGNFLDASTYVFDEKALEIFINAYSRFSGWKQPREMITNRLTYIRENKEKINHYRGELLYMLEHFSDSAQKTRDSLLTYLKRTYQGIRYETDTDFEPAYSWNYVIYDSSCIEAL